MMTLSRWKIFAVVAMVLLGILFALPNVLPANVRDNLPPFMPKRTINLGLDLQGGSYLLLQVETEALIRERISNMAEEVDRLLDTENIEHSAISTIGNGVQLTITKPDEVSKANSVFARSLQSIGSTGQQELNIQRQSGGVMRITLTDDAIRSTRVGAVDQSIEIIRRRVDELGTREPNISRQGLDRIVVQAPGESDPEKLKNVIGQTARLTFQMVDEAGMTSPSFMEGRIPPGSELLPDATAGAPPVLVRKRIEVSGEMLTGASQDTDDRGQIVVAFRLNGEGAKRFGLVSTNNIGKRFAIVLDGKVISYPTIQSAITGGSGQITGNFTVESANELAVLLRAGALPAPLKVEEQRTVGPGLGADAVEAGRISTIIAFVSVLVFMVLAYGVLFGGVSVIALLANGLLIIAAMSMTGAALTLPGIAGLILTLAVAVDANVLIYERMRDEVRSGRPVLSAMDAGFSRAIITIFDANITHLGAAAIMFSLGAGPVKGFAWTLAIGVFTSVFTAVMITQVLLALWFRLVRPKTLPIV